MIEGLDGQVFIGAVAGHGKLGGPLVSTAPAPRNSKSKRRRPVSGSCVTCRSLTTCPILDVSVSTATAGSAP